MSQLKKRCEMDPKWTWNLNDILNGTEAFNALFEKAEKALIHSQKRILSPKKSLPRRGRLFYFAFGRYGAWEDQVNDSAPSVFFSIRTAP